MVPQVLTRIQNIIFPSPCTLKMLGLDCLATMVASRVRWPALGAVLVMIMASMLICLSPAQAESFDRQNLRMVNLANQDLRGNDYTRADLADANLSHANLRGVRMFDTTLVRANLEGLTSPVPLWMGPDCVGPISPMQFWLGLTPLIRTSGKLRLTAQTLPMSCWLLRLMLCCVP